MGWIDWMQRKNVTVLTVWCAVITFFGGGLWFFSHPVHLVCGIGSDHWCSDPVIRSLCTTIQVCLSAGVHSGFAASLVSVFCCTKAYRNKPVRHLHSPLGSNLVALWQYDGGKGRGATATTVFQERVCKDCKVAPPTGLGRLILLWNLSWVSSVFPSKTLYVFKC